MSSDCKRFVLKIGTKALRAERGPPDKAVLGPIVNDLVENHKLGHEILLVSSGAVGCGRQLIDPQLIVDCDPILQKQILASHGQPLLMKTYDELLAPHRLHSAQLLLTKLDFETEQHASIIKALLERQLKLKISIGIANENDSVANEELKIGDNDQLAGLITSLVNADRLIIITHDHGIYDRNPREAGAKLISEIHHPDELNAISSEGKSDAGSGGAESRLRVARLMMENGIAMHVVSVNEKNVISRLLSGEKVGTTIHPLPNRRSTKQVAFQPHALIS